MRTSAASEHRLDRLVRLLCPWMRPKPKRLDLRFVSYVEGEILVQRGWTVAREEQNNRFIGMVWVELLEGAKCQSCKDGYNGENGNGYPAVGKFALYEDAVRDAKGASAEFNKIRKAMPEWQPIETAPKDGTWVYVCRSGQAHTGTKVAFSHNCGGNPETWWDGSMFYRLSTFTHWTPLPPPPDDKGEK